MELTIPYAGSHTAAVMTVTAPLSHRCPIVHEADHGEIVITYKPAAKLLELHALAALLRGYITVEITHEELTTHLAALLRDELKPEALSVTTSWTTAGLGYTVSA